MVKSPLDPPPMLSARTVALMIELFESMYRSPTPMLPSMFDIEKLPTILFAMEFERVVIEVCEHQYCWDFKTMLPALYDGSFFARIHDGGFIGRSVGKKLKGQHYLKGFATVLCGSFTQHLSLRTSLNEQFEQSLLQDGFRFDGKVLTDIDVDTSTTPELAKLPKRDSLLSDLSTKLQSNEPTSILFIDLDHFKEVNDRLSHSQGDICLVAIVETISDVLRYRGKLYRVGGDEFCAVLPNFLSDEALAAAERIRSAIDALQPFGDLVKVTASIGVACSESKSLQDAQSIIEAADQAMYVSKFTGKNRVCVWPPSEADAAMAKINRENLGGRRTE